MSCSHSAGKPAWPGTGCQKMSSQVGIQLPKSPVGPQNPPTKRAPEPGTSWGPGTPHLQLQPSSSTPGSARLCLTVAAFPGSWGRIWPQRLRTSSLRSSCRGLLITPPAVKRSQKRPFRNSSWWFQPQLLRSGRAQRDEPLADAVPLTRVPPLRCAGEGCKQETWLTPRGETCEAAKVLGRDGFLKVVRAGAGAALRAGGCWGAPGAVPAPGFAEPLHGASIPVPERRMSRTQP